MMWTKEELRGIDEADDLKIAPFRDDGATLGTPTWIWSVSVDGDLYVRGYQAARRQKAGRIIAAGATRDVRFAPVEGTINDRADQAYKAKYGGSPYLAHMIADGARNATIKITPCDAAKPGRTS
jgi:hypothetical protein